MNKLKLAIDAARNDDMERVIKLLEEALAERSNHESELMMNDGNYRRKILAEPELNLNCKSVQKRLATVWGYVKDEQVEQEPVANKYNHKRIGWELERTAQGESYYGNALYVAMDLPFLNKREKDCLHRYMHGSETPNDRFVLQDIAMKVYSEPEAATVRTKDLTDEEIAEIVTELDSKLIMRDATELEIARAVIAKFKEKNNA